MFHAFTHWLATRDLWHTWLLVALILIIPANVFAGFSLEERERENDEKVVLNHVLLTAIVIFWPLVPVLIPIVGVVTAISYIFFIWPHKIGERIDAWMAERAKELQRQADAEAERQREAWSLSARQVQRKQTSSSSRYPLDA